MVVQDREGSVRDRDVSYDSCTRQGDSIDGCTIQGGFCTKQGGFC